MKPRTPTWLLATIGCLAACSGEVATQTTSTESAVKTLPPQGGQAIFRSATYGDERFWTEKLKMNTVIATSVSPATALAVGLKVYADAVPTSVLATAHLNDPATTVALIGLN